MVFADISGFTKMSERLARHGKVGAEEVTDAINTCFEQLLGIAYSAGGSLLKFGGDALLLLFSGDDHVDRAAHAAVGMRHRLRTVGRINTSSGLVVLRISMGLHSGTFHAFAVGDSHRELVVAGPAATATVEAEGTATAGEIVMSAAAAALLPARCRGPARGEGFLLRSPPGDAPQLPPVPAVPGDVDVPNYVPTAIRKHLLDGVEDSEHRSATVAFLHFDGTDGIVERDGPEVLAAHLHEVVRIVQEAADEAEVTLLGTDIDHDGGKLILVAGVPRRVGDDEERMLTALRKISEAPLPIPLRIGAHTGPVFAGAVGPAYRRTFTVMGDTVNLAARVMSKAAPGQVLVTPDVLERSQLAFETEALEPFSVKGKRKPVTAFALGAPKRARRRRSDALPLVGRADELAALDRDLAAAVAGESRFVEIVADPGMGKSRLIEVLRARAEAATNATQCITIRCEAYESSAPYASFWILLRYLLGVDAGESRDVVECRLRDRLDEVAPDLLPLISLVATPLDLDLADPPDLADLEPAFRRERVDEVTATFLQRAARASGRARVRRRAAHGRGVGGPVAAGGFAGDAVDAVVRDAAARRKRIRRATRHRRAHDRARTAHDGTSRRGADSRDRRRSAPPARHPHARRTFRGEPALPRRDAAFGRRPRRSGCVAVFDRRRGDRRDRPSPGAPPSDPAPGRGARSQLHDRRARRDPLARSPGP